MFLKSKKLAERVTSLVDIEISTMKGGDFPRVLMLPELVYRAAGTLTNGSAKDRTAIVNSYLSAGSDKDFMEHLTICLSELCEELFDAQDGYVIDAVLGVNSPLHRMVIHGESFATSPLYTVPITIFKIPFFKDGENFGILHREIPGHAPYLDNSLKTKAKSKSISSSPEVDLDQWFTEHLTDVGTSTRLRSLLDIEDIYTAKQIYDKLCSITNTQPLVEAAVGTSINFNNKKKIGRAFSRWLKNHPESYFNIVPNNTPMLYRVE